MDNQKKAVVFGASGAIGGGIVRQLSLEGFSLLLVGRNEMKLNQTLDSLLSNKEIGAPHDHEIVSGDLMANDGYRSISRKLLEFQPNVAVHAFGSRIEANDFSIPKGCWRDCMDMLFFIPLALDQILIEIMEEKKWGKILHISSSSVLDGSSFPPYVSAKAALNQYINTIGRKIIDDGISLSGIMPAAVEGENNFWGKIRNNNPQKYESVKSQQPIGRFQTPDELALCCKHIINDQTNRFGGRVVLADGSADADLALSDCV